MAGKKAVKKEETPVVEVVEVLDREITHLDPAEVVGDDNIRLTLKAGRVEALKEEIIRDGGITAPVEVEPLTEEEMSQSKFRGKLYRITFGHYRLAAIQAANKEGYFFPLPAMVVAIGDPIKRLRRQLSENLIREELSPIAKGIAIKKLLTAGVSKQEVRNIFSTPGGRKGLKAQPASNSFINMTVSFLDLPPKIYKLIDDGEIGVADAYFLTKQTPENRDLFVEKAIARRLKELEQDEEDENKFLESEKKKAEAEEKATQLSKAVETAESEVEAAISDLKAKAAASAALYLEKADAADSEAKKLKEAEFKAAEEASKQAEKDLAAKRKELAKQKEKAEKIQKSADERAEKLKSAREAAQVAGGKKTDGATTKPLQVKASAAVDVKNAPNADGIAITHKAILKVISDMSLTGSYPKVTQIGRALGECFSGRIKDDALFHKLAVITGEKVERKAVAK